MAARRFRFRRPRHISACMKVLTIRQQEILAFIQNWSKWRVPTVREIAKHFEVSASTAQEHIRALRKKGYLPERKRD